MSFQIITILICCQLQVIWCDNLYSKFQQTDYKIEFIRLETAWYNKDFYGIFNVVTFKYNRSLAVANVTFQANTQIDNFKMEVIIQVYKFLSNEYRIFPIHFQLNVCRLAYQNIAGVFEIVSRCGNITDCNFKKGIVYHTCNIYPDQSRFPPFIPNGEYKVELTLVYNNLTLCILNAYGKAFRPIKIH